MLVLSSTAGMSEGWYNGQLFLNTSHPEMQNHEMFLISEIVPRYESMITEINDVYPDQGGFSKNRYLHSRNPS